MLLVFCINYSTYSMLYLQNHNYFSENCTAVCNKSVMETLPRIFTM